MNDQKTRAKKLLQVEKDLNNLQYKGIGLGSLLANTWTFIYNQKYQSNLFNRIGFITKMSLLGSFKKKLIVEKNKKNLYFKTGNHRHYNQIFNAVIKDETLKAEIFSIGKTSEDLHTKECLNCNLIQLIKITFYGLRNHFKIYSILKKNNIKISRLSIILDLIFQLIQVQYWQSFLKRNPHINFLIGDSDRGGNSAPLFLVFRLNNLKTISIQHGMVNPPYGYTPIISDYLFVWSELQKKQIISIGGNPEQIIITGTPTITPIEITTKKKQKVIEKYNIINNRNIVLAINPIKDEFNFQLISFFSELKTNNYLSSYNFFLKLHPAQSIDNYSWVKSKFNIDILPKSIELDEFFNITDLLLVYSSGIIFEALYYGIKVAIIDILPIIPESGLELNKFIGLPIITDKEGIKTVLEKKYEFDPQILFFKTGAEAENEIVKQINKIRITS